MAIFDPKNPIDCLPPPQKCHNFQFPSIVAISSISLSFTSRMAQAYSKNRSLHLLISSTSLSLLPHFQRYIISLRGLDAASDSSSGTRSRGNQPSLSTPSSSAPSSAPSSADNHHVMASNAPSYSSSAPLASRPAGGRAPNAQRRLGEFTACSLSNLSTAHAMGPLMYLSYYGIVHTTWRFYVLTQVAGEIRPISENTPCR